MASSTQRLPGGEAMSPDTLLHVHDLPQLYTKPSSQELLQALKLLTKPASTFVNDPAGFHHNDTRVHVEPFGVPQYLTSIVSSSLKWLDEEEREQVWELASVRLSERSGRSAAPAMTRSFKISDELVINLHEPSLTGDSLGLKTWTSSLLLSKRLSSLSGHFPRSDPRVLELGSGTGLVGLAAAFTWRDSVSEVLLTDLPEIVPNLAQNIQLNAGLFPATSERSLNIHSRVLDWADESHAPSTHTLAYPLVLAADPLYSPEHPRMLVSTVKRWLKVSSASRFIVELPLREAYIREREHLRCRLQNFMTVVEEGTEVGYDDWEDATGQPAQVKCWWSVWRLSEFT